MRQLITGMVAAVAVVAASAAPAMACGLFDTCSPCTPCAAPQVYVPPPPPVYSGCNPCGGAAYERLPDPEQEYGTAPAVHQYYYADQGPTYTGPGDFAPHPVYREGGWGYRHHIHHYGYGFHPHAWHHGYHYGYEHHGMRYGYAMPHHYGYREHTLRRYY
jgi:hypothetical protein